MNQNIYLTLASLKNGFKQHRQNLQHDSFSLFRPHAKKPEVFTTFVTTVLNPDKPTAKVFALKNHIERVSENAHTLGIISEKITTTEQESIFKEVAKAINIYHKESRDDAKVRLIIRENCDLEIFISPYENIFSSPKVSLLSTRGERFKPEIKSTFFSVSEQARLSAKLKGHDESLLINNKNEILECAWSNIFWFDEHQQLCTTEKDILLGITREAITKLQETKLTTITLPRLLETAKEIFITQSTSGISFVSKIDEKQFSDFNLSKKIKKAFNIYKENHSTSIELT